MPVNIGRVEGLFRYPVKSMRGEPLDSASVGWHGIDGDRRLAFRRVGDGSGFPWLTAGKLPQLILYAPQWQEGGNVPTHVRTPAGRDLPLFGEELAAEIASRHGSPVEMMYLDRGIFDEASISLITSTTVAAVAKLSAHRADVRRFRPNILIESSRAIPFEEDDWLRGVLTFGDDDDAAAVTITNRDERCGMVNFDPDSAETNAAVLKTIVRERDNKAGVYGTITRRGRIAVGQSIFFEPERRA